MSSTSASGSEPGIGAPTDRSVYDFLYADSRRIASYLSQFEGGHLTQLTRSIETGSSASEDAGRQFAIGAPKVLGGGSHSQESNATSEKEGMIRTFDPYWTNARAFLDFLSGRDLIERDICAARMGQFVLVTGKLAILNLGSMQNVWALPIFRQMLAENMTKGSDAELGSRQQRRSQGKVSKPADPLEGLETIVRLAIELLPTMPHFTTASIIGEFWSTWSTLTAENLVGSTSDLMLKHGNKIAGEWSMLGVLDALPDAEGTELDAVDKLLLGISDSNIVATATIGLTPGIRMVAGRPSQSFGLTPLLIFREIAQRTGLDPELPLA